MRNNHRNMISKLRRLYSRYTLFIAFCIIKITEVTLISLSSRYDLINALIWLVIMITLLINSVVGLIATLNGTSPDVTSIIITFIILLISVGRSFKLLYIERYRYMISKIYVSKLKIHLYFSLFLVPVFFCIISCMSLTFKYLNDPDNFSFWPIFTINH